MGEKGRKRGLIMEKLIIIAIIIIVIVIIIITIIRIIIMRIIIIIVKELSGEEEDEYLEFEICDLFVILICLLY